MLTSKIKYAESRYKRALGEISVEIAELEAEVVHSISDVLSLPRRLTASLIGSDSLDILIAKLEKTIHYYIRDNTVSQSFKEINKSLCKINEKRNTYIHSRWDFEDDSTLPIRHKYKRKYSAEDLVDSEFVELKDLKTYTQEVQTVKRSLRKFMKRFRASVGKAHQFNMGIYYWEWKNDSY